MGKSMENWPKIGDQIQFEIEVDSFQPANSTFCEYHPKMNENWPKIDCRIQFEIGVDFEVKEI